MSWPNRYFGVRMYPDRYFGPVEDTAQFIAVVESSTVLDRAISEVELHDTGTSVTRTPTYVFLPVNVLKATGQPESDVAVVDASVSTSDSPSASEAVPDAHSEPRVTSEVRYFVVSVESSVNKKVN